MQGRTIHCSLYLSLLWEVDKKLQLMSVEFVYISKGMCLPVCNVSQVTQYML